MRLKVDKPTIQDFIKEAQSFKTLCRNVLGSGQGKELLNKLRHIYVDGNLYDDSDRQTVYLIAQRDLIMELIYNVQDVPDEPKLNGEEIE